MVFGGGAGAAGFFTGYLPSSEGATSTPEARACTTDIDADCWSEFGSLPEPAPNSKERPEVRNDHLDKCVNTLETGYKVANCPRGNVLYIIGILRF